MIIDSLKYLQKNTGLKIYAFVVLENHLHALDDSESGNQAINSSMHSHAEHGNEGRYSTYGNEINSGKFITMPAIVEEMYDDENRATTKMKIIEIKVSE